MDSNEQVAPERIWVDRIRGENEEGKWFITTDTNCEGEEGWTPYRLDTVTLAKQGSPQFDETQKLIRAVLERHYKGQPTVFIDQLWDDISGEIAWLQTRAWEKQQGSPPADEITAIAERNYYLGLQHGAKEWRHLKPEAWHCQKCAAQLVYDGESYVCNRCERLWPAENIVLFAYADLSDEMFITKGTQ